MLMDERWQDEALLWCQRQCPSPVDGEREWNWHWSHNERWHPHHPPTIEIFVGQVRKKVLTDHHAEQWDDVHRHHSRCHRTSSFVEDDEEDHHIKQVRSFDNHSDTLATVQPREKHPQIPLYPSWRRTINWFFPRLHSCPWWIPSMSIGQCWQSAEEESLQLRWRFGEISQVLQSDIGIEENAQILRSFSIILERRVVGHRFVTGRSDSLSPVKHNRVSAGL